MLRSLGNQPTDEDVEDMIREVGIEAPLDFVRDRSSKLNCHFFLFAPGEVVVCPISISQNIDFTLFSSYRRSILFDEIRRTKMETELSILENSLR